MALCLTDGRIDAKWLVLFMLVNGEVIDADDNALTGVDLLRDAVRRTFNLRLLETGFDRGYRTTQILDLLHQRDDGIFELIGHRFNDV